MGNEGGGARQGRGGGASGVSKQIEQKLFALHADDAQPNVDFPRSGIPASIDVTKDVFLPGAGGAITVRADFKNTSETVAKAWLTNRLVRIGIKNPAVRVRQTGDYHNDWVTAAYVTKGSLGIIW